MNAIMKITANMYSYLCTVNYLCLICDLLLIPEVNTFFLHKKIISPKRFILIGNIYSQQYGAYGGQLSKYGIKSQRRRGVVIVLLWKETQLRI